MKYVTEAAFTKMVTLQKGYIDTQVGTKQDKFTVGKGLKLENGELSVTLDTTISKVVESLPSTPDSGDENKIFLVLEGSNQDGNLYKEYLWINSKWEEVGTFKAAIDLTPYLKAEELTASLSANKVEIQKRQAAILAITFGTTLKGNVSGTNFSVDLAEVLSAEVATGLYKFTVDKYGRVTSTEAVAASDIEALGFVTSTSYAEDKAELEEAIEELEKAVGIGSGSTSGTSLADRVKALEDSMANIEVFTESDAETLFNSIYK